MLVINDTLGAYGGTHTLTLRICKWLSKNLIKSAVICISDSNKEITEAIKSFGTKIYKINLKNIKEIKDVFDLYQGEEILVINYMWDCFLDLEVFKKKVGYNFRNILYCVHYGTFLKGNTYPGFVKKNVKKHFKAIYEEMVLNNSVIMMDEDTIEKTENYFEFHIGENINIVRLPLEIDLSRDFDAVIDEGYKSNIIMTAARAEFPYKGYLIGIIDEYYIAKRTQNDLKLIIVTGGEEEEVNKISSHIKELDETDSKDIEILNWMDYEKLKQLISKCKLYIGMGTTVLDSALLCKPVLSVQYNTYDCVTNGLFSSFPDDIAAFGDGVAGVSRFINHVFGMTYEQYKKECKAGFQCAKDRYDIDNNMRKILETKQVSKGCILQRKDIRYYTVLNLLRKLKLKGHDRFDVDRIKANGGD